MPRLSNVISGVSPKTPIEVINNDKLVESFNCFVTIYNTRHSASIAIVEVTELQPSSSAFIDKTSGILRPHTIDKQK